MTIKEVMKEFPIGTNIELKESCEYIGFNWKFATVIGYAFNYQDELVLVVQLPTKNINYLDFEKSAVHPENVLIL